MSVSSTRAQIVIQPLRVGPHAGEAKQCDVLIRVQEIEATPVAVHRIYPDPRAA
jgi:hypothetical protein